MAKARRLRVVLKPAFYVLDANGQRVQIPGKTIEFISGRYETKDEATIAGLLNHDYCNIKFMPVDNEQEWKNAHPDYFRSPIEMITGAVATINSPSSPLIDAARSHIPARQSVDPVVNIEEIIDKKLNVKFDALSDKVDRLMAGLMAPAPAAPVPVAPTPGEKPKRVFKCPVPGCEAVFATGIDVGAHKKLVHMSHQLE